MDELKRVFLFWSVFVFGMHSVKADRGELSALNPVRIGDDSIKADMKKSSESFFSGRDQWSLLENSRKTGTQIPQAFFFGKGPHRSFGC